MTVSQFIETLGGIRVVAQHIGAPYTTVHSWVRANRVPQWRMAKLAEMAGSQGKSVPAQFESKAA